MSREMDYLPLDWEPRHKRRRVPIAWELPLIAILLIVLAFVLHDLPLPSARASAPSNEVEACQAWREGKVIVENVPAEVVAKLCNSLGV